MSTDRMDLKRFMSSVYCTTSGYSNLPNLEVASKFPIFRKRLDVLSQRLNFVILEMDQVPCRLA
jgi:hypothetical protein